MKKKSIILFFIFIFSFIITGNLSSQNLEKVLINKHYPVYFLGLDFSESKFIGNSGVSGYTIRDKFFSEWNYLFYSEKKKYNIGEYIKIGNSWGFVGRKDENWARMAGNSIKYRTDIVEEIHKSVDPKKIVLYSNYNLEDLDNDKLQEVVNRYDFEPTSPVALTFIVNYFNWLTGESKIAAVFFNSNTKEILFSTSITGKGSGKNFRNFWMNSIEDILGKLKKIIDKEIVK